MLTAAADYHMHSNVSPDGTAEMEEMCRAALRQGLREIALTDHYEFFSRPGPENPFSTLYLEDYFTKLERCRALFSGKLCIRAGMELGQSYLDLTQEQELLRRFPFDYVIGSLHKLDDVDLADVDYKTADVDAVCGAYLTHLYLVADRSEFDCMGHFDLVKRYAARNGISVRLLDYGTQVRRVLERLIQRGKGIEINTSGLRQEARETLPSLELLRLYRSLGGELLTIGSDAHRPGDVGKGLPEALELAKAAGFTRVTLFENRSPRFQTIA